MVDSCWWWFHIWWPIPLDSDLAIGFLQKKLVARSWWLREILLDSRKLRIQTWRWGFLDRAVPEIPGVGPQPQLVLFFLARGISVPGSPRTILGNWWLLGMLGMFGLTSCATSIIHSIIYEEVLRAQMIQSSCTKIAIQLASHTHNIKMRISFFGVESPPSLFFRDHTCSLQRS